MEAGLALPWRDVIGDNGRAVSIEQFGASADYETLFRELGVTPDTVVSAALDTIRAATQSTQ